MNIIIYGSSGVGKTTIAEKLYYRYNDVEITKIHTDRKQRPSEIVNCLDYEFIPKDKFNFADYPVNFSKFGNRYGISSNYIQRMVRQDKKFITIIGDIEACKNLKKATNGSTLLVYLFAQNDVIKQRLISRGQNNIEKRMGLVIKDNEDYLSNLVYFDKLIRNESNIQDAVKSFCEII